MTSTGSSTPPSHGTSANDSTNSARDEAIRRGRRRSRTPAEIRSAMLDSGLALLGERGVSVGLDRIRFDDVIVHAGVPRASAYRAWKRDDADEGQQVIFHDALAAAVVTAAADEPHDSVAVREPYDATLVAIDEVVTRLPDLASLSDAERGDWFQTIHRTGTSTNQRTVDRSGMWLSSIAIAASLASQREISRELFDAWRDGDLAMSTRFVDLYRTLAATFGFRIRPCYKWEHFAVAAAAMGEGLATRATINEFTDGITRRTGPNGEEETWPLFSVAFEGLLRQFLEPDPDAPFHTPLEHEPY